MAYECTGTNPDGSVCCTDDDIAYLEALVEIREAELALAQAKLKVARQDLEMAQNNRCESSSSSSSSNAQ